MDQGPVIGEILPEAPQLQVGAGAPGGSMASAPGVAALDVPDRIRQERSYFRRWMLIRTWLEDVLRSGDFSATKVVLEADQGLATMIGEVLNGVQRNEENHAEEAAAKLPMIPTVTLATVDGQMLACSVKDAMGRATPVKDPRAHLRGIKVGELELDSRQLRRLRAQGLEPEIYREFGVLFDVPANDALWLLRRHGYRVTFPQLGRKGTDREYLRGILFEVGGPFQDEVVQTFGWKDPRVAPEPPVVPETRKAKRG